MYNNTSLHCSLYLLILAFVHISLATWHRSMRTCCSISRWTSTTFLPLAQRETTKSKSPSHAAEGH